MSTRFHTDTRLQGFDQVLEKDDYICQCVQMKLENPAKFRGFTDRSVGILLQVKPSQAHRVSEEEVKVDSTAN